MNLSRIIPMAGVLMLTAACASPDTNTVKLAQERQSCAEIGIDPGSDAFGQCAANLDMTMFDANNTAPR